MKKSEYVVTFLFNHDCTKVWLIEKQKPEWQKGLLNGIGGKIEEGETPVDAAFRELKEEAGYYGSVITEIGYMEGTNNDGSQFKVEIFAGRTNEKLYTVEKEEIVLVNIEDLPLKKTIGNVPMLIEACRYRLGKSSNFKKLIMQY